MSTCNGHPRTNACERSESKPLHSLISSAADHIENLLLPFLNDWSPAPIQSCCFHSNVLTMEGYLWSQRIGIYQWKVPSRLELHQPLHQRTFAGKHVCADNCRSSLMQPATVHLPSSLSRNWTNVPIKRTTGVGEWVLLPQRPSCLSPDQLNKHLSVQSPRQSVPLAYLVGCMRWWGKARVCTLLICAAGHTSVLEGYFFFKFSGVDNVQMWVDGGVTDDLKESEKRILVAMDLRAFLYNWSNAFCVSLSVYQHFTLFSLFPQINLNLQYPPAGMWVLKIPVIPNPHNPQSLKLPRLSSSFLS